MRGLFVLGLVSIGGEFSSLPLLSKTSPGFEVQFSYMSGGVFGISSHAE